MRARQWIAAALLGLACAAPAQAGDPPDAFARIESLLDPRVLFQGVVREEDVSLLFAHLRAALIAAQEGREAPPPEALNQRAEAIAAELKTRGTLAGLLLLTAFEAAARQAMREALTEPASSAP
ncbi:MAG: hypothetical protein HYY78_00575 [Betaproteobacteria bacterium]|nr:hypothetical protein [Betaproteobacteria bacterium]